MKTLLLSSLISIGLFYLVSDEMINRPFLNKNIPIGTVIYSILPPKYFQAEHPNWVLLDGGIINKSSELKIALDNYGDYKKDVLPNALGVFLRSSNINGIGKDPAKDRPLGSFQKGATAKPNLNFFGATGKIERENKPWSELDKNYDFNARWEVQKNGKRKLDGYHKHKYDHHSHSDVKHGDDANYRKIKSNHNSDKKTGFDIYNDEFGYGHYHELIVNRGGDRETRPINISFYTYIKIN